MLDEQLYLQYIYSEIGYKCQRVSAKDKKGLEELKAMMIGKVSMFSGHSGVGKSTLVNALEPELNLKTKNKGNIQPLLPKCMTCHLMPKS